MNRVIPVIGSVGYYQLAAPFDRYTVYQVEYTCRAVRKISDYLANNEEVYKTIYEAHGLSEEQYEEDLKADGYIVSLQSSEGQPIYVPYQYILSYPSGDGVPYRSVMMGVSLPPLPLGQDLSAIIADVKSMVESRLGINVVVRMVETSKVIVIAHDDHQVKQQQRQQAVSQPGNLYVQNLELQRTVEKQHQKLMMLQDYVKNHLS